MKRILVLTLAYAPFVGGAEISVHEVITRLKKEYQFEVVTARMKPLRSYEIIDGIPIRRLGLGIAWIDKLLFFPLALLYGLFSRCDIVFGVLENQAALAARALAFLKNVKCVINLQSGDSEQYIQSKLGMFSFLYSWVYAKKPKYVVLSKYLQKRARSHGVPDKHIVIIPNGVDRKTFSCNSRSSFGKHIITASRLTLKNAVDDIIKALPLVRKQIPQATLTICGVGEDEEMLRALAKELDIEEFVHFAGLVPYKKLPSYLCTADVFARPSLSEGFGNSFIEALSCGVPIVGTRVGGIPDFLVHGKTGLFCRVRKPSDLAAQIVLLLSDQALSQRIVETGQKMIDERYDWSIIAAKFNEVFR